MVDLNLASAIVGGLATLRWLWKPEHASNAIVMAISAVTYAATK